MSRLRHPIRAIREPFGKAGLIVAIIALAFAMVGGAYAAGKLTSKQKKEVEKIAKKYAGKPGAPGAAGTNGTNGTNGKDGTAGAPGANGKDGASVTNTAVAVGNAAKCNKLGGSEFTVAGGSATYACNGAKGEEGSPWTDLGTLPEDETETGSWAVAGTEVDGELPGVWTGISFTIPLSAPLGASEVHFQTEANFSTTCTGSIANPTAPSGHLCVYGSLTGGIAPGILGAIVKPGNEPETGATVAGTALSFKIGSPGFGLGTWAVTG